MSEVLLSLFLKHPIVITLSKSLSLLFIVWASILSAQSVWYVNQNVQSGQQNGVTWTDAFIDLQQALTAAHYGDEIWIASGVYLPTATSDRSVSFHLKNGVKIYGGFLGAENNLAERNPALNITRLSGNIGNDSLAADNSYHVLYGQGLDDNTLLDGLVISDGYSKGPTMNTSDQYGAGMYLVGSSVLSDARPIFSNCRFEHNSAGWFGGAIYAGYIDLDDPFQAQNLVNPYIVNCVFENNEALHSGGALFKSGPSGQLDSFILQDVSFIENHTRFDNGGGIYFEHADASKIIMKRLVFDSNDVLGGIGGGFSIRFYPPGDYTMNLVLDSCIFRNNSATEGGGFSCDGRWYLQNNIVLNLSIQNCLFEGNNAKNTVGGAFIVQASQNDVINSTIKNTTFNRNYANSYFASAILSEGQSAINASVENCIFTNNVYKSDPSYYLAGFSAGGYRVNTQINNCLFAHNGAGIFAGGPDNGQVSTKVTNCTFFKNGLLEPLGLRWFAAFDEPGSPYFNKMTFYNCVLWEPGAHLADNNNTSTNNSKGFFFDYCSVEPTSLQTVWEWQDVVGDSLIFDFYPDFEDTSTMDFRLKKCSPLVNRGFNPATQDAGLIYDLDGAPRARFGRVDMGAYESQDSCFEVGSIEPHEALPQAISLQPNVLPPGATFHVRLPENEARRWQWQVKDATGRRLFSGQGDLPAYFIAPKVSGVYFLEMVTGKQKVCLRFVVAG